MNKSRRSFLGVCAGGGLSMVATRCAAAEGASLDSTVVRAPDWPRERRRILDDWLELLGPFPNEAPSLEAEVRAADAIDGIPCRQVSFQTEAGERVPGFLLVPQGSEPGPSPAVIVLHSTTMGSGKRASVGLSGRAPGDPPFPPETSRAVGLELARWGYVTLSIDLLGDGERIAPGMPPCVTTDFYARHPEWSAVGKIIWDVMRAVDFLRTLDFVDPARIACAGHSLGGHSSLFAAAFDDRIAAAICNGGVYGWRRNEDHWSRPETSTPKAVESYIYIKKFRPYLDDPERPVPADFDGLMMSVAPRPLLVMQTESEMKRDDTIEKAARTADIYRGLGAGDRFLSFSYPGDHNFPPCAKRLGFSWLDRWFDHTPLVPTIWPGHAV